MTHSKESAKYVSNIVVTRAVAKFFLERNEETVARVQTLQSIRHLPVLTFGHFVPRHDLNPSVFRRFPG
jgi:hypothetical protein